MGGTKKNKNKNKIGRSEVICNYIIVMRSAVRESIDVSL
jgi:hypothetical protein